MGEIFHGVAAEDEFRDAARSLWHGLTRGDQRRSARMLRQDVLVTRQDSRIDAAAELVIAAAVGGA